MLKNVVQEFLHLCPDVPQEKNLVYHDVEVRVFFMYFALIT